MRTLVLATRISDPTRGDPAPWGLLVRALGELGHEVHLVCDASEPTRSHASLTVHAVHPQRTGVLPAFAPRAAEAAKRCEPECVLADRDHLALAWMLAGRSDASLVPVLGEPGTSAPSWSRGLQAPFEGRIVRGADACVAFGPAQGNEARARGARHVIELPGVSSLGDARPMPNGWLRSHLGLESGLLAVSWGELSPEAGTDIFIEGVKVAADSDADIHAVILGGDQTSIDRYEAKAQRLGIEQRVHLLGTWPAAKLGTLVAEADILVEPSLRANTTPNAFYTFLGSGRPVLVAEAPGRHRLVSQGACVFAPPDRLGIGHALGELVSSEAAREQSSAAGLNCVAEQHTYDAFRAELEPLARTVGLGPRLGPARLKHPEGLRA